MVAEPAQVAFFGGIYEFVLCERHEVKVFDAFLVILNHAASKYLLVNHFSNVLKNKIAGLQVGICSETKSFLFRLDNGDIGVLFS